MHTLIMLLMLVTFNEPSVHSFSYNTSAGNTVQLSSYAGKKILIVNTALNSPDSIQIKQLEQLQQANLTNLIVIAFPSNDFGHEPNDNQEIDSILHQQYNIHYQVAIKGPVLSTGGLPLFNWLATKELNGVMDGRVRKDFYKYLINEQGELIGIFSEKVSPLSIQL